MSSQLMHFRTRGLDVSCYSVEWQMQYLSKCPEPLYRLFSPQIYIYIYISIYIYIHMYIRGEIEGWIPRYLAQNLGLKYRWYPNFTCVESQLGRWSWIAPTEVPITRERTNSNGQHKTVSLIVCKFFAPQISWKLAVSNITLPFWGWKSFYAPPLYVGMFGLDIFFW